MTVPLESVCSVYHGVMYLTMMATAIPLDVNAQTSVYVIDPQVCANVLTAILAGLVRSGPVQMTAQVIESKNTTKTRKRLTRNNFAGHGRCVSMKNLAMLSEALPLTTGNFSYGSTSQNVTILRYGNLRN